MDLVIAVRPPWTLAQREGYLEKMMDDALAVGLTGVHDAMTSKADYDMYTRRVLISTARELLIPGRAKRGHSGCGSTAWYVVIHSRGGWTDTRGILRGP